MQSLELRAQRNELSEQVAAQSTELKLLHSQVCPVPHLSAPQSHLICAAKNLSVPCTAPTLACPMALHSDCTSGAITA